MSGRKEDRAGGHGAPAGRAPGGPHGAAERPARPRLVFFQWNHQPNAEAARYLLLHMQHHVRCLAESFDVTVVNEDCDYDAVCDRLQPDLALFEAGYRSHGSRRITIRNTSAHPAVPRLGLHNGDPWCDRRAGFLSDMAHWGVESFFSIGTCMPDYTPAAAGQAFVWPNFIDPALFHDRRLPRVIPVMLSGHVYGLYPWRAVAFDALARRWPCLTSPQVAYEDAGSARLLTGEAYARALSASLVVPSCGTMGHELVRKHLEIPGAGALLVAEPSAALAAAGFEDGVNCVLAAGADVAERVDRLMAEPERLRAIALAGHRLVHARHTLRHRPQIRQWYELNRRRRPGQRIVQPGPFLSLELAEAGEARQSGHVPSGGLDRALLLGAAAQLARGRTAAARAAYTAALGYVAYLPEARFGLALCALEEGAPAEAAERLAAMIEVTLEEYGAADPDPLEWALYLAALLCAGRRAEALALRGWYPALLHPGLRGVRALLGALAGEGEDAPGPAAPLRPRPSLHRLPQAESAPALRAWLARCAT
ncbi:glycosyltransferase, partial [Oceanicella sp. SM1341]|uniref:glycosyltransferase family protein n=1 Tax=Oceanicella sp. SM1341 TaxID=1548889 RepID=UPI0013006767